MRGRTRRPRITRTDILTMNLAMMKPRKPLPHSAPLAIAMLLALWMLSASLCLAEEPPAAEPPAPAADIEAPSAPGPLAQDTLDTLASFVKLRNDLLQDIQEVNQQLAEAMGETEKQALNETRDKLERDLRALRQNFENLAAGIDTSSLSGQVEEKFDLQQEIFGLLKPALDEMKSMTSTVRKKSELRDKLARFDERIPVLEKAVENVRRLKQQAQDEAVTQALGLSEEDWSQQLSLMRTERQAAQIQLDDLVAEEVSFTEASGSYLKSFFQKRGLYLTVALLVVAAILVLSRLSLLAMQRYLPGFRKPHRSFRIRLTELTHRIVTLLLVILGPMAVFYVVEDWVLFSLGVLLLLGLVLALRTTLPGYVKQIQLFLNVGPVREGERIELDGLPWRVDQINFYSNLTNPEAGLRQRVPIDELLDKKSRPTQGNEPWFPCHKDDWVILADGERGKVIGISPELVQLVERGGAHRTYRTEDFLAQSPRNLGTNFRIKETLGISYGLQKDATDRIPALLQAFIQQRIEDEGYADDLLNLRVEFERANSSSLDIVVIADFKGSLGDLYNRLRRAIQRWCVDACTQYDWEIPFPQLTLHGALVQPNPDAA